MKRKAQKLLSLLLSLVMVAGLLSTAVSAAPITFKDVKSGAWYYNDVQNAVDTGLINGYPDNTFKPDKNMTYAEAIKLAAVMYKLATTGSSEFSKSSPWYKPYADYAKEVGVISKDYDWDKPATRAGYMEIFAKAIPDHVSNSGMKALTEINSIADNSIPDVSMSHPQAAAIYKLYRAGILQGNDSQHSCKPDSNIRRSEVAAILTRMMNAGDRLSFSLGEASELKITAQPKDTTVNKGEKATFTVAVSGGKAPYTYQWHEVIPGGSDKPVNLVNGDTLTVNMAASCTQYYCVITDAAGKTVTSEKATLTVTPTVITETAVLYREVGEYINTEYKFSNWNIPTGSVYIDSSVTTFEDYGLGIGFTNSKATIVGTPTKAGTAFARLVITSGSDTYHFDFTVEIINA